MPTVAYTGVESTSTRVRRGTQESNCVLSVSASRKNGKMADTFENSEKEQWSQAWSGVERRGECTSTRTRNFCFNESCSPFKRFNYSTIKSHSFVIFSYLDGRRKHEQWIEECLYKIKSLLIQERQIKRIPSLHYRDCCFFVYFGWFFFVTVCSSPGEGAHAGRTGRAHTKLHTRSIQRGHVH